MEKGGHLCLFRLFLAYQLYGLYMLALKRIPANNTSMNYFPERESQLTLEAQKFCSLACVQRFFLRSILLNTTQYYLHFLVGNPFPPVFWLRLSSKITSYHTPLRCPNFSRNPTSLNPHFRCKVKLAIFSEIISAVIVQYFSFSDATKRALSKAEPIPCLCFSCLTCTLTSATPT